MHSRPLILNRRSAGLLAGVVPRGFGRAATAGQGHPAPAGQSDLVQGSPEVLERMLFRRAAPCRALAVRGLFRCQSVTLASCTRVRGRAAKPAGLGPQSAL